MGETIASPLAGKTIVVTRAIGQSGKLVEELTARQAKVIQLPVLSFSPPEDFSPMDAALARMNSFDWIIFTSANAVQAVERRMEELGLSPGSTADRLRAAAVGPATAEEAEHAGFSVDYVAATHNGASLAAELKPELKGKCVFLPRSDRASTDLPDALRCYAEEVTEAIAYRTLPASGTDRDKAADSLRAGVDGILFFSPSAVHNFVELAGKERVKALQGIAVMVAIGPTTAMALTAAGFQRIARAVDTTNKAVVEALEGHLSRSKKRGTEGAAGG